MPLLRAKRPPSAPTPGGMGRVCRHTSTYALGSAWTYQLCDTAGSQLPRASVSLSVKGGETPSGVAGRTENVQNTQRMALSPRSPGCQHRAQSCARAWRPSSQPCWALRGEGGRQQARPAELSWGSLGHDPCAGVLLPPGPHQRHRVSAALSRPSLQAAASDQRLRRRQLPQSRLLLQPEDIDSRRNNGTNKIKIKKLIILCVCNLIKDAVKFYCFPGGDV